MAPTTPANHDPALCHPAPATPTSQPSQTIPQNITPGDIPGLQLDQTQIMNLLRSLPSVFTKVSQNIRPFLLLGLLFFFFPVHAPTLMSFSNIS
jgi:hypothetical protein